MRFSPLRAGLGWLLLGLSVAAYLAISRTLFHQPFHVGPRELRFFDLRVYRGAARRILLDAALYHRPIIHRLGFTYPPAAALLLAPLGLLPLRADEVIASALNVLALVWIVAASLRLAQVDLPRLARWSLAAGAAAGLLWLEPVTVTLGYGQIDLLIVSLVILDLARGLDARGAGIAIGIAAGLKLTPLVFLVFLALAGHQRVALRGVAAFVGTVVVSFLATGGAAAHYWGGLVLDSSRVGGAADAANQSLRGALARLTDTPHPGAATQVVVLVVALAGLGLAVRAHRRGDSGLAVGLCSLTTLLASPVSWTHHWTLAIPALVLLAVAAWRQRSASLALASGLCLAVGYAYIPERFMPRDGAISTGAVSLAADPYVLIALGALAGAATVELRSRLRTPSVRGPSLALPVSG